MEPNSPATEPLRHQPPDKYPAAESAYDEDGVDVSLIRWMLSLTPTERLEALQSFVDFIASATSVEDSH
jgi:hypothetical protein